MSRIDDLIYDELYAKVFGDIYSKECIQSFDGLKRIKHLLLTFSLDAIHDSDLQQEIYQELKEFE